MKNYWLKTLVKPQYLGLLVALVLLTAGAIYQTMNPTIQAPSQFVDTDHSQVGIGFSDHDSSRAFLPNSSNNTTAPDYLSSAIKEITTASNGNSNGLFRVEGQVVLNKQWLPSETDSMGRLVVDLPPQQLLEPQKFSYNGYDFTVKPDCTVVANGTAPGFSVTGVKVAGATAALDSCQVVVEKMFSQSTCGTEPLDVILAIDRSGSMAEKDASDDVTSEDQNKSRLDFAKEAANLLVDLLDKNGGVGKSQGNPAGLHHVGVVSFSTFSGGYTPDVDVTVDVPLGDTDASSIKSKINSLTATYCTPISIAMATVKTQMDTNRRTIFEGKNVRHIFVFLSDGRPVPDYLYRPSSDEITDYLKGADQAYSIALGAETTGNMAIDLDLMHKLAKPAYISDDNPGAFRWVKEADNLSNLYQEIFTEIACNQISGNFRMTFKEPILQTNIAGVINALKTTGNINDRAFLSDSSCSAHDNKGYLCLKPSASLSADGVTAQTTLNEFIRYANLEISGNVAADELSNLSVGAGSIAVGNRITNVFGQVLPSGSFSNSQLDWSKVGGEISAQFDRGKQNGRKVNNSYFAGSRSFFNLNAALDDPSSSTITSFSTPPEGKLWYAGGNVSFFNEVSFTGSGTLVVDGNVNFFKDLRCDANTRLGIIARGEINFKEEADSIGCGAFVALKKSDGSAGKIIFANPTTRSGALTGILIAQDEVILPSSGRLTGPYAINYDQYFATHPTILFREILEQRATAF